MSRKLRELLRLPAEKLYRSELRALIEYESHGVPDGWKMSPRSVLTYILGGRAGDTEITPKYVGSRALVEVCIASLLTDRALLLAGEPGTAKSWLAEHLAAAVCGDSTLILQGSAGLGEEQVKYGWNYALLIADGPSERALVKTPVFTAMEEGRIVRFEEITRSSTETSDALISVLSEKSISIPELRIQLGASKGFGLIATANLKDHGVRELSSALRRRFNIIELPLPASPEEEIKIVSMRLSQLAEQLSLPAPPREITVQAVTVCRELRTGCTLDRAQALKPVRQTLSTGEIISVLTTSMAHAESFGNGIAGAPELASALTGLMQSGGEAWTEYREMVLRKRGGEWRELYDACRELWP